MTTLFLKYRPQNFADLVGQDSVVKTLKNALQKDIPAHAYLFVGSRGTGKTSSARIFAKGLNSFDTEKGDILENELTNQISAGDCVDIVEIDAASHTGVDNIRDLIEKVQFLPTYAKRKVYIIDEVHMLSKGAFNALLKTLEEPPAHAYFLLATTEMHKVPETIISRCQTFIFHRFTIDQLVDRLEFICKEEGFTAEKEALTMIAKQAEGGLRDAISLLEQMAAETDNAITVENTRQSLGIAPTEMLEQLWKGLQEKNTEKSLEVLHQVSKNGADFRNFGHDFLVFLRGQLYETVKQGNSTTFLLRSIESIQKALLNLKISPVVELPLEIAVIELTNGDEAVAQQTTHAPAPTPQKNPEKSSAPSVSQKTESKPVMKEEKIPEISAPEKSETSSSPAPVGDLSVNKIVQKMEVIASTAGIPIFVKKSFMTSSPQLIDGGINFSVSSSFHLEQIDKAEHKSKIAEAIEKIFGTRYSVSFSRGLASNAPSPKPEKTDHASADDFLSF